MPAPSVFISYSHDSTEHKSWVLQLATDLRGAGVDATLDQWDLVPGQDVATFMHDGIAKADWTCPASTDGLEVLDLLGIFNQIDLAVAVN